MAKSRGAPSAPAVKQLAGRLHRADFRYGEMFDAVLGTLVGIGFTIAGLPGPVVFGVLATVSALLPFGGAALVWLPGALYLLSSGHFGMGIFMLIWGVGVSSVDNFVKPWLISQGSEMPFLLIFFGVIGSSLGLRNFRFGLCDLGLRDKQVALRTRLFVQSELIILFGVFDEALGHDTVFEHLTSALHVPLEKRNIRAFGVNFIAFEGCF